jgi:WD40 repeat protein
VRIWDSSTGLSVHTLHSGRTGVTAVAYAVDGQRLAAGTDDGTVTVWPVQDWQ